MANLAITPLVGYTIQYPWQLQVPDQQYTNNKKFTKKTAGVSAIWDARSNVSLVFGTEYSQSDLWMPENPGPYEETFKNGSDRLGDVNISGFAQMMLFTNIANLTLGGRYDKSRQFGSSFVPRLGLTKYWQKIHLKLMASQSFRVPGGIIPNRIPAGCDAVSPEKATSYEIEAGYRLAKDMLMLVNGYDVTFNKVIVYQSDPATGVGSYFNSGKMRTQGFEAEYRYLMPRCNVSLNYAYYRVAQNSVQNYSVPVNDKLLLAAPAHRLNAILGYKLFKKFSINPSISVFGERYGFVESGTISGSATDMLIKFKPLAVANINFRAKDIWAKGLELDLGVRDIANSGYAFIEPYNGGHAPLPASSRAVTFKIAYNYGF